VEDQAEGAYELLADIQVRSVSPKSTLLYRYSQRTYKQKDQLTRPTKGDISALLMGREYSREHTMPCSPRSNAPSILLGLMEVAGLQALQP
jgi:hypothetical protein